MTIIRELLTVIGFPVDEEEAKKADKTFDNLFDKATHFANGFNEVFDALNNGLAVVVSGAEKVASVPARLFELAEAAAQTGDRVAKTGVQIGLTAEELQRLEFAAERSGVEVDGVRDVLKDLSKNLSDAGNGNKTLAATFGKLGVNVRNSDGQLKTAQQVLLEVADGLQNVNDPARRAQLSMQLMGEQGLKMAPLLQGGSAGIKALTDRADELGFVMSNEAAAASEAFLDQLTDMRRAVSGLTGGLGISLFPALGKILTRITAMVLRFKPLIEDGFELAADAAIKLTNVLLDGVETIERHSTFLKIMLAILTAVGTVIFVQLLPALYAYIAGLNLVTLAQLKAIAIPALMVAGFLALAAVIGLVIEDIYRFVSGGESALGNLFDAFQDSPADPDEHWMVSALRFIITTTVAAVRAVDEFFKGFFQDAEEAGGVVEALGTIWDTAVDAWFEVIREFFDWIWGQFRSFSDFSDQVVESIDNAIMGAFRSVLERAKSLGASLADIPLVGRLFADGPPDLASPQSPASRPVSPSAGLGPRPPVGAQTSVANTVQGGPVTVNVNAGGGSPQEIGTATAASLAEVMERDRRETQRILEADSRTRR